LFVIGLKVFFSNILKAIEVIPRQLCDNSGFDTTIVINKLRYKHDLSDEIVSNLIQTISESVVIFYIADFFFPITSSIYRHRINRVETLV